MLLETIVSALIPVGIEGVKQLITKATGGVKPTTIAEQIQLQEAENATLQVVAALDNPYGTPSQWVVDLRAASRYVSAILVIILGMVTLYIPQLDSVRPVALELVGIVFGFLFGHRVSLGMGKK